jgi:hypothetical protein
VLLSLKDVSADKKNKDTTNIVNSQMDVIFSNNIQGVTEISALILTSSRTQQKEQLFSLPFWRKTLRNGLKKVGKIFVKPFISPKLSYLKT